MEKYAVTDTNDQLYDFFGVHRLDEKDNIYKYIFRIAYIKAKRVELIGDFISGSVALNKTADGIWEILYESDIPIEGMRYRYKIFSDGEISIIADPFSRLADASNASIIVDPESSTENDNYTRDIFLYEHPMNICVVDIACLNSKYYFSSGIYVNYREISSQIIEHLEYMSYTHLELTSKITYGSFCLDSNYGSIDDFKFFIDSLHREGKGIILDIHFNKDNENMFFYGSEGFRSFVISTVMYWFRKFNIDGIKLDLQELKLYGDEKYLLELLGFLNKKIHSEIPGAFLIANDHLSECALTAPLNKGGAGFSFKLNRGWLADLLDYLKSDSNSKQKKQSQITFSLNHACVEQFILPITEKASEINILPNKISNIKLLLGNLMLHQGKKSMFEFDFLNSSESIKNYRYALNSFYINNEALWELDNDKKGFKWIACDREHDCVIVFKRFSQKYSEILCIFNFSLEDKRDYSINNLVSGTLYREVFNSDDLKFGGAGRKNNEIIEISDSREMLLRLPPLSVVIFEPVEKH